MAITTTVLTVPTTGNTYNLPGAFSAQDLVAMYGSSIPGLGSMESKTEESGNVRTITFSPRQGQKG